MDNLHLFELINAPPGIGPWRLLCATTLAQWPVYLVAAAGAFSWIRGDLESRRELLQMLMAALLALALAQVIILFWPQPRPSTLHLGTQYLAPARDSGLPSRHVAELWALGVAALGTRRFGAWAFALLALGLLVGISRVYLGAHFPFDILAALPVAVAGAGAERLLRSRFQPATTRLIHLYDRAAEATRSALR